MRRQNLVLLLVVALALALALRRGLVDRGLSTTPQDIEHAEAASPELTLEAGRRGRVEAEEWAPTEDGEIQVLVLDAQTGEPLGGVLVVGPGGAEIGETSLRGILAISIPGQATLAPYAFRKEGYSTTRKSFDWRVETHKVLMEAPGWIEGRVVDSSGGSWGVPFDVVLWDGGDQMPEPHDLGFLHGGEPAPASGLKHVRTDSDGRFAFPGYGGGRKHMLVAGAPGLLSDAYGITRGQDGQPLKLVASPAYGAVLRFVDELGEAVDTSALFAAAAGLRWSCNDTTMKPSGLRAFAAVLCGIEPGLLEQESSKVLLFSYETQLPEIGPCWLNVKCPGYEEAQSLFAPTALVSQILEEEMVLIETPAGRSTVVLDVDGASYEADPSADTCQLKLILLHDESGRKDVMTTQVSLAGGRFPIEGVPAGDFRFRVESSDGFWSYPDKGYEHLKLLRGERHTVEVDLSEAGAIAIVPFLPTGELYDRYLTVMGAPGSPRIRSDGVRELVNLAAFSLEQPPYAIPLVSAGEYTLRGLSPRWGAPAEDGYLSFRVSSGEVSRLEVITQ